MPRDFRTLKDQLEIYFFNSQEKMIRTAEEYLAQNPNQANLINSRATTDQQIRSTSDFYGYNRNSPLTLEEQYSYDQLKLFSDIAD